MTDHSVTRWVVVLTILAIVSRIVAAWATDAPHRPQGEEAAIAQHLLAGDGYAFTAYACTGPTSIRGPLMPLLLYAGYAAFGASATTWAVLGLNALAGGAATYLAFVLARRVALPATAAVAFMAAIALWPTQVIAATYVQPLAWAVALALGAGVALLRRSPAGAITAGLLIGLLLLGEPRWALPLLLLAVLITWQKPALLLGCAAGAIVLVGPWLYRNAIVHGGPTGITNATSAALFAGNNDKANGSLHRDLIGGRNYRLGDDLTARQFDALRGRPESERNALLRTWACEWIANHPLAYVRLCGIRLIKTLWLDYDHPLAGRPAAWLPRSLALALAVAAIIFAPRRRLAIAGMAWAAAVALVAAPVLAEARNGVAVDLGQLFAAACLLDRRRPIVDSTQDT